MLVAADKHIIYLSEACLVEVADSASKSLNKAARFTTNRCSIAHVGSSVSYFPGRLFPRSPLQLKESARCFNLVNVVLVCIILSKILRCDSIIYIVCPTSKTTLNPIIIIPTHLSIHKLLSSC